jgi:hypothetical protein
MTEEEFRDLTNDLEGIGLYIPSVGDFLRYLTTLDTLVFNEANPMVWNGYFRYGVPLEKIDLESEKYKLTDKLLHSDSPSPTGLTSAEEGKFRSAMDEFGLIMVNEGPEHKGHLSFLKDHDITISMGERGNSLFSYRYLRFSLTEEALNQSSEKKIKAIKSRYGDLMQHRDLEIYYEKPNHSQKNKENE